MSAIGNRVVIDECNFRSGDLFGCSCQIFCVTQLCIIISNVFENYHSAGYLYESRLIKLIWARN